jgi:hypothetical protein
MSLVSKILSGPFLITILRYALGAAGAWLASNQGFDPGTWETISGSIVVIVVALMGGAEATKDKAVVDGKSVPVDKLPEQAQSQIKQAVTAPTKKRTLFDMFVGK